MTTLFSNPYIYFFELFGMLELQNKNTVLINHCNGVKWTLYRGDSDMTLLYLCLNFNNETGNHYNTAGKSKP